MRKDIIDRCKLLYGSRFRKIKNIYVLVNGQEFNVITNRGVLITKYSFRSIEWVYGVYAECNMGKSDVIINMDTGKCLKVKDRNLAVECFINDILVVGRLNGTGNIGEYGVENGILDRDLNLIFNKEYTSPQHISNITQNGNKLNISTTDLGGIERKLTVNTGIKKLKIKYTDHYSTMERVFTGGIYGKGYDTYWWYMPNFIRLMVERCRVVLNSNAYSNGHKLIAMIIWNCNYEIIRLRKHESIGQIGIGMDTRELKIMYGIMKQVVNLDINRFVEKKGDCKIRSSHINKIKDAIEQRLGINVDVNDIFTALKIVEDRVLTKATYQENIQIWKNGEYSRFIAENIQENLRDYIKTLKTDIVDYKELLELYRLYFDESLFSHGKNAERLNVREFEYLIYFKNNKSRNINSIDAILKDLTSKGVSKETVLKLVEILSARTLNVKTQSKQGHGGCSQNGMNQWYGLRTIPDSKIILK